MHRCAAAFLPSYMMQLMKRAKTRSPKRGSGRSCFSAAVKDLPPILKLLWLGSPDRPSLFTVRIGQTSHDYCREAARARCPTLAPHRLCLALALLSAVLGP